MENLKFDEYWNREKIEAYQLDLLHKQLDYIWQRSKFYRRKFQEVGLIPSDIKTLKDLEKIPFTTKEDLKKYNDDFICVAKEDIIDYCSTTGTTGRPVLVPLIFKDWRIRIESFKERFSALNIKKGDVVQNSMAFDQLFGLCIFYDAAFKELGITSLRLGPGNSKRQIEIMLQVGTTVIVAVPEYMLVLADTAREMGFHPAKDFKLKKGILITQNLYTKDWKPNALKKQIEEIWKIETFSSYGSTELMLGFYECLAHGGHHIPSQEVLVEIINPETGEILGPEQEGELVFTHLIQKSMPLLRFRQGDITYSKTDTCACGRNTPRMMSTIGRTDQMIKIKGTSFYPYQIEEVLMAIPEISSFIIEIFTDEHGLEQLKIKVCIVADEERVIQQVKGDVKSETRITPIVEICSRDEIEAKYSSIGTRKIKKFWDNRKIKTS